MKWRAIFFLLPLLALSTGTTIVMAQNQFEILVFTQYDQYHKESIPAGIRAFQEMAVKHQFGLTWTMDADVFAEGNLKDFAAIVFLQAKADGFTPEQKEGLKKFINNGGGFVGIHATSTTDGSWPWYSQLVGRIFVDHPRVQSGIIGVVDDKFPAALHLPDKWIWTDEWYNFGEAQSDNLKDILVVDESSYDTTRGYGDPIKGMGDHHPVAWHQEFDGGRSFYSALGHKPEAYQDERNLEFLYGAIYWAATGK